MKRNTRRLPIPQNEFGFTADTFNLIIESTVDCERIARERTGHDEARRIAEAAQTGFRFQPRHNKPDTEN
jgi:hypothetical protein